MNLSFFGYLFDRDAFEMIRNFDKTKLVFRYNVLSEKPMDYVSSGYDDKFEVQILDNKIILNVHEVTASFGTTF